MDIDLSILRMLEREKEISFDVLVEAIEQALLTAYHKTPGAQEKARVELDRKSGHVTVLASEVDDEGNVVGEYDDTPAGFGRIAATTAKQIMLQRLRDAEDDIRFGEFSGKEGDIISGVIQQGRNPDDVMVDLGKLEALLTAYHKTPGAVETARVQLDRKSGHVTVFATEVNDEGEKVGEYDDTPDGFGRIAATTAKQIMLQRLRDAEDDIRFGEFSGKEGDIVSGIIQQGRNPDDVMVDLGKLEALLPAAERVPGERYEHGTRIKCLVISVRRGMRGPQVHLSRSSIRRMFMSMSTGVSRPSA